MLFMINERTILASTMISKPRKRREPMYYANKRSVSGFYFMALKGYKTLKVFNKNR